MIYFICSYHSQNFPKHFNFCTMSKRWTRFSKELMQEVPNGSCWIINVSMKRGCMKYSIQKKERKLMRTGRTFGASGCLSLSYLGYSSQFSAFPKAEKISYVIRPLSFCTIQFKCEILVRRNPNTKDCDLFSGQLNFISEGEPFW